MTAYGPTGRPCPAARPSCSACPCRRRRRARPSRRSGTSPSSSSPWRVPSSPKGPCRSGRTTSTWPSVVGHPARRRATRGRGRGAVGTSTPARRCRPTAACRSRPRGGRGRPRRGPSGRPGDPDRDDVVAVAVDRAQHAGGRHAADGVLAAAATEDDGDAGLGAGPASVAGRGHRRGTLPGVDVGLDDPPPGTAGRERTPGRWHPRPPRAASPRDRRRRRRPARDPRRAARSIRPSC